MLAYANMAERFASDAFWAGVTLIIGDERLVPLESTDSNWGEFERATSGRIKAGNPLVPPVGLSLNQAAETYSERINGLSSAGVAAPRMDHVWLGMGEDGHTLSLFPGRLEVGILDRAVIPIDNSPKPPPQRITLTLGALSNVGHCVIMATGAGKAEVLGEVFKKDSRLPVAAAARYIESHGGTVTWLLDEAAGSRLKV